MIVHRRSDRKKAPTPVRVRAMTREEVLALRSGQRVAVLLNDGRLGECKINGAVRTWKRDSRRIEVPVKYGMREFATFSLRDALARLVVIEEELA